MAKELIQLLVQIALVGLRLLEVLVTIASIQVLARIALVGLLQMVLSETPELIAQRAQIVSVEQPKLARTKFGKTSTLFNLTFQIGYVLVLLKSCAYSKFEDMR